MSRATVRLVAAGVFFAVTTAAVVVVRGERDPWHRLITAANALGSRPFDGRLAAGFAHWPVGKVRVSAWRDIHESARSWERQWLSDRSRVAGHLAGSAFLLTSEADRAFFILGEVLRRDADNAEIQHAVQISTDAALLNDFSAAALQRPDDPQNLLLAYEAADRAWQLAHATPSGWNRAIAAERIGMPAIAGRFWQEVEAGEGSSAWAREAEARRQAAAQRAAALPDLSLEMFFYRRLIVATMNGEPLADVVPGDHLASDIASARERLSPRDRERLKAALASYLRGRDAFERNEFDDARKAYAAAEEQLVALGTPVVLIARDQRIRSECSQGRRGCVESMHAFRREVESLTRYPWLAARGAYGEGQVLYREGHIYEAAEHLQRAQTEFQRFGDTAAAGYMHVLLANVYAAGGESDLAMRHFLDGLQCRAPEIRDRRRKILEDAIMFALRHGYLSTAELLLQDLAVSSTTDASNVTEQMLQGVVAFRRGDRRGAADHFRRARALLPTVRDDASRADVQFRLAIAEAGSRMMSATPILIELDASIAAHEQSEFSIWLPQLLMERGSAWERLGQPVRAESDYRQAMDILERRELRIDETVLALGITTASESPFDRAIRLFLSQGRITAALSVAQRSNSLRISSLHARGAGVRDTFAASRTGGDGIAELQRVLEADQYAVAQHLLHDELITWIVSKDGIRAIRQPVRVRSLTEIVDRLNRCAAHSCDGDDAALDFVSNLFLRSWIEGVSRGATLLIQPPAEFETLCFSMLKTRSGERLIARNSFTTAPSFQMFARALTGDRTRARPGFAFFAAAPAPGGTLDPLPRAAAEVRRVSRLYARAETDPHATRAAFLSRSVPASIIHFAGHVVVNTARPLFSALAFDDGEMLYVHELDERSFANARLIVLSACDTGRSPRPTMSVANALLSQSVPSVVYTLWPVSDDAAEAFAVAFHRAIASGKSRAEAVREAQMWLLRRQPSDSQAWAAFALAGAPGPLER
jgi:tetratricopeptide (TPR) repeat protein